MSYCYYNRRSRSENSRDPRPPQPRGGTGGCQDREWADSKGDSGTPGYRSLGGIRIAESIPTQVLLLLLVIVPGNDEFHHFE